MPIFISFKPSVIHELLSGSENLLTNSSLVLHRFLTGRQYLQRVDLVRCRLEMTSHSRILSGIVLANIISLVLSPVTFAQSANSQTLPENKTLLKANVKIIAATPFIKRITSEIKQVEHELSSLDDEVNIQTVVVQLHPDLIGAAGVVNAEFESSGASRQPRKEKLDRGVSQIKEIVADLQAEEDAFNSGLQRLDLAPETETKIDPIAADWDSTLIRLTNEIDSLRSLTATVRKFDNAAISNSAQKLLSCCKVLQKDLHAAQRLIQKDNKRSDKV